MSIPRLLLAPTHRTGLANAVAAALAEIVTAQGRKVRYHHLGPLAPGACWDRWEGTAFLDPDLYDEESLLRLYDVATRSAAPLAALRQPGRARPARGRPVAPGRCGPAARLPGGAGPRLPGLGHGHPGAGRRPQDPPLPLNLAGALLSGVADRDHCELLRRRARRRERARGRAASSRGTAPAGRRPPRAPGGCRWSRPCWRRSSARSTSAALVDSRRPARVPLVPELADRPGQRRPAGHGRRRDGLHALEPRLHRGAALGRGPRPPSRPGRGRRPCPRKPPGWCWPAPSGRRASSDIAMNQSLLRIMRDAHQPGPAHPGSGRRDADPPQQGPGLAGADRGAGWGAPRRGRDPLGPGGPGLRRGDRRAGQPAAGAGRDGDGLGAHRRRSARPRPQLGSASDAAGRRASRRAAEGAGTRSLLCSRALIHLAGSAGPRRAASSGVRRCTRSGRFW